MCSKKMENNSKEKIDRFLSLTNKLGKLKKLKTKTRFLLDHEIRHRQDIPICNTLVKNLISIFNQLEVTRKQILALDLDNPKNQKQIEALKKQCDVPEKEKTIWHYEEEIECEKS